MIEGGNAGGSALAQASQRRATAERLTAEAAWLEQVAADERAMASELAQLPETYTILHDLQVPGSKGNVDHVVVGPGGAFLVITRRHEEGVAFREGELFVGSTPMKGDLEVARQEAQLLSQALGVPVVPVLGLYGAPVPASVPPAIEGVLITPADRIDRVVVANAHTMMPTPKIAETAERALPLLHSPGTTPRVLVAAAARQAVPPPIAPMPPAAAPAARPTKATAQQEKRRGGSSSKPLAKFFEGRSGGKKSAAFIAASIGSLCLVAFAAGSLIRVLWPSDSTSATPTVTVPDSALGSTTTIFIDAASTVVSSVPVSSVPPVAAVPAPLVNFTPACSAPGAGWTLVPNWPGDLAGLAEYVLETQAVDGTWQVYSGFTSVDTAAAAAITGQGPSVTVTVQILARMADGSVSTGTPTALITPATAC